jgi:hypothetical protein
MVKITSQWKCLTLLWEKLSPIPEL